ncbi:MAG TPA: bifunctional diaminohydroxyphosphoribosylaminopyrimidine deaminase/5-amino-6-(5-phosphoribosylamino)uracil reductase RibD [Ignavibacteriaceae bacterium]|nr:bifunctional diaminohydroxyphosphoribosylaminopyrimidine deaminase/5-amino-6-(5-phosphoribosylamino)uracil reductase RibD [Ignavibacteriaceae bacterium]
MEDHSKYIRSCFKLAKKGKSRVSPNPFVGAVLVKNGKVIGKGYHKKFGAAHAEVNAIKNSTEDVTGSTLYCNLEPCCHTNKQTPPCVPLIIQKKIKRVVISNPDPNKEVDGKGVEQLREAGIEVISGILEDEGKVLNKFYFKYAQEKIPFITLKIAQSIDGKISLSKKEQTWLTGKESIKYVHKLRSKYDAVLVGANTVKVDDPLLTVRDVKGRNPIRIVIDGKLSIPLNSNILNTNDPDKTWIFTSQNSNQRKLKQLEKKGVKVFSVKTAANGRLNLKSVLKVIAKNRISSVLVEGGQEIFSQFFSQKLFDELIVLQSPKILGKGLSGFNSTQLKNLPLLETNRLGQDTKLVYGKKLSD